MTSNRYRENTQRAVIHGANLARMAWAWWQTLPPASTRQWQHGGLSWALLAIKLCRGSRLTSAQERGNKMGSQFSLEREQATLLPERRQGTRMPTVSARSSGRAQDQTRTRGMQQGARTSCGWPRYTQCGNSNGATQV